MANKNYEHWDNSETIYERGYIKTDSANRGIDHSGYVATEYGYVVVQSVSQTYADGSPYSVTMLEFIHNGRNHRRHYTEYFRPRYLVTLAKRFAAEIVGEETVQDAS